MAKGRMPEWETAENLTKLKGWAAAGLNNEQIAHNIGINASTVYEWLKRSPKIAEALKKGKEVVDFEVENALHKRAVGMRVTEQVKELRKNEDTGEIELAVVREVVKELPPDPTAAIIWLKNRKPAEWRDRKYEQISEKGEAGVVILPEIEPTEVEKGAASDE